MYVVMIASECAPVAKVGGLADVVFGLSRELEIRGHSVEVILPKYDCMRYDQIWGLQVNYENLWVPWDGGHIRCTVWFGFVHGRKCFFIEPHSHQHFFERGAYYGFPDEAQRFAFFSRAALEFMRQAGKRPDIIHTPRLADGAGAGAAVRDLRRARAWATSASATRSTTSGTRASSARACCGRPGSAGRSTTCARDRMGDELRPRGDQLHQGRHASTPISSPPSRRTTPGRRGTPSRAAGSATRCTCTSASSAASSTASTTRCGTRRSTR